MPPPFLLWMANSWPSSLIANNLVTVDGNGFSDIFTYERESLPPTVDSTSPADSANGVAVGSSITATFSEPMNGSTIDTNTFTLDNGVTGTVTYDAEQHHSYLHPHEQPRLRHHSYRHHHQPPPRT